MTLIIDLHAHVFPDWIEETSHQLPVTWSPDLDPLLQARRKLRKATTPWAETLHQAQTWMRTLPKPIRAVAEWVGGAATASHLLVESTPRDLLEEMNQNETSYSVIIASPPLATNPFILDLAKSQLRFVPAVYAPDSPEELTEFKKQGARFLKIHPAHEGLGPDEKNTSIYWPRHKISIYPSFFIPDAST